MKHAARTRKLDSKELSSVQSLSMKHVKTIIIKESMAAPADDPWKMCQREKSRYNISYKDLKQQSQAHMLALWCLTCHMRMIV